MTHPRPVLVDNQIYVAHDRFVCTQCAGATALHTGVTIGGSPLRLLTAADVVDWPADLGPLTCECQRLTVALDEDSRLQVVAGTPAPAPPQRVEPTPPQEWLVQDLTLRDVVEDVRLLLDGSTADVDGIRASADPHPALDPAASAPGEGAMVVTFTDSTGRHRVAELAVTARWREDNCWHTQTTQGALGEECTDCGMVTKPTEFATRCPQCKAPVGDAVKLFGVHTASCTLVMCQCEHIEHESDGAAHPYLGAVAGDHRAQHVGRICDECATGHLAEYLITDDAT